MHLNIITSHLHLDLPNGLVLILALPNQSFHHLCLETLCNYQYIQKQTKRIYYCLALECLQKLTVMLYLGMFLISVRLLPELLVASAYS